MSDHSLKNPSMRWLHKRQHCFSTKTKLLHQQLPPFRYSMKNCDLTFNSLVPSLHRHRIRSSSIQIHPVSPPLLVRVTRPPPWKNNSFIQVHPGSPTLPTPTRIHHHRRIAFQHHQVVFIDVQHRDGRELCWDATDARRGRRVNRVRECLDDCMVGGIQMLRQGEQTLTLAVKRLIAVWSHDPVIPPHVTEIHIKIVTRTRSILLLSSFFLPRWIRVSLPVDDATLWAHSFLKVGVVSIVEVGDESWPQIHPIVVLHFRMEVAF